MAQKSVVLQKRSAFLPVANRGSILIISLWAVCLLSAFAVILSSGVRQKIILVQRFDERDKLRLIAEAGAKKAICKLLEMEWPGYDTLKDKWSNDVEAFRGITVGDGSFDVCYNYTDDLSGATEQRWGLIDEERKININRIDIVVLTRLFIITLGLDEAQSQELAASIIDWRDKDSELSIPSGSAEDSYYRFIPHPYECKDADFENLNELLLVKGMTGDIFEKIKDYITIYGSGKVNINTASKQVILALGLSESITDKVITFRAGEDGVTGTADDNFFEAAAGILTKLSQFYHFNETEIAQLTAVSEGYLATNSENFMIKSSVRLNNKKRASEGVCVVNKEGRILYWQEP
jgi:type II secretory pathway component PulK